MSEDSEVVRNPLSGRLSASGRRERKRRSNLGSRVLRHLKLQAGRQRSHCVPKGWAKHATHRRVKALNNQDLRSVSLDKRLDAPSHPTMGIAAQEGDAPVNRRTWPLQQHPPDTS